MLLLKCKPVPNDIEIAYIPVLLNFPKRVSQQGIIDVSLSDHQLMFSKKKYIQNKTFTKANKLFPPLKIISAFFTRRL